MTTQRAISLEVTHPDGSSGPINGFRFLWAYYVSGYRPDKHCQPCFIGARVPEFCTPTAMSGRRVELNRMHQYPYVYICGVGSGPKSELWQQNLHFPLRYAEGRVEEVTTYNDYRFRAENAERVTIPELPEGWEGKPRKHTRCKNFQFAVAMFGNPPAAR